MERMDELFLKESAEDFLERRKKPRFWKVIVADDDPEIIRVTDLACRNFEIYRQGLQLIPATSARECIEKLKENPDTAVILMDVIMETETAGLDAVDFIRTVLKNKFVRIVIRTGYPGQVPEKDVFSSYDINAYKEKTELTSIKLYTTLYSAISQYRQLRALDDNRRSLEQVIASTVTLFKATKIDTFSSALLRELITVLYDSAENCIMCSGIALSDEHSDPIVSAATGEYVKNEGFPLSSIKNSEVLSLIKKSLQEGRSIETGKSFCGHFRTKDGTSHIVYVESQNKIPLRDKKLLDLFIHNVAIIYENLHLNQEIIKSQTDIILLLTQAIEEHSMETKLHVKRVSEYSKLLGKLNGLSDEVCLILCAAAMLHDTGKISIPDSILQKPGPLNKEERALMETHAEKGQRLLEGQKGEMLSSGALVAGQHHEKWDGTGYPNQLKGNEISLFGRISALCDVFDALTSKRVYKDAWPVDKAVDYIKDQRGRHFDPKQVDLFLDNLELFLEIKRKYPDPS